MLVVTLVIDNSTASPLKPEEYVKENYLTDRCIKEMTDISIIQTH